MRQILNLLIFCLAVSSLQSCVSKKKYDELEAAKTKIEEELSSTQQRVKTLEEEKAALESEMEAEKTRLNNEIASIKSDLDATKAEVGKVKEQLSMTEAELKKLKDEINGIFAGYTDSGLTLEESDGKLLVATSEAVKYRSGSVRLSKDQRTALDELAETLKNNPKLKLLVQGHTDSEKMKEGAPYRDNWDLSVARAMGVVRYLIKKGANPDQLSAVGKGEFDPVSNNDDSDGKAANRRTDIAPDTDLGTLYKKN